MGAGNQQTRKAKRTTDRKFVFDWDAKEDTSQDFNDLYNSKHQIQMYGRGHIAGIDIKEQRSQGSKFYQQLLAQRRSQDEKQRAR